MGKQDKDGYDNDDVVLIYVKSVKYETDNAVLFDVDGLTVKQWLPKSQIKWYEEGNLVAVELPYWLCEKEGLEGCL